ncbi:hypothetical protein DKP78_14850, partial [Enterococcus faecium]
MKALVLFQYDDKAWALQRNYRHYLNLMENSIPLIWTHNDTHSLLMGPTSTANSITASYQQQRVPPTPQQDSEALTP